MAWLLPKKLRPASRAEEREKSYFRSITNDMLLAELDAIFLESSEALKKHKHPIVMNVLKYLIMHDLELRRIIGFQFHGKLNVSERTINNVIELQSHYNLFRTNLIVEIVKVLLNGYNKTINNLSINYDYSMEWYKYIKKLNDFYLREIRKFLGQRDADEYQYKIYEECMNVFQEVQNSANDSIRKLINIQLRALQF